MRLLLWSPHLHTAGTDLQACGSDSSIARVVATRNAAHDRDQFILILDRAHTEDLLIFRASGSLDEFAPMTAPRSLSNHPRVEVHHAEGYSLTGVL
jgi:hypothetical protein